MSVAPAIRIGDREKGMCDLMIHTESHHCPHSRKGELLEGSENVFINGIGAGRVGDSGICNCPHGATFIISSGSGTVFINGSPAAATKHETTCEMCGEVGNLSNGSDNVFIGD